MRKFLLIALLLAPNAACGTAQNLSPEAIAQQQALEKMHENMMVEYSNDADIDFVRGMIPHHQGAIDMAEVELKYGKDPELRKLAAGIIKAQKKEIRDMQHWQASHDNAAK